MLSCIEIAVQIIDYPFSLFPSMRDQERVQCLNQIINRRRTGAFPSLVNFTLVSCDAIVKYFITKKFEPIRKTRNNRTLAGRLNEPIGPVLTASAIIINSFSCVPRLYIHTDTHTHTHAFIRHVRHNSVSFLICEIGALFALRCVELQSESS